jgi:hypothetical protein
MSSWNDQQFHRDKAKVETERLGFKEGELQWLWRNSDCFKRKYDMNEVVAAICDALTREGQTAWPGDGTSCVEQMIRLQWERAEKAEAELAALRARALTDEEWSFLKTIRVFHGYVKELDRICEKLRPPEKK